jgi:hypothetical protein
MVMNPRKQFDSMPPSLHGLGAQPRGVARRALACWGTRILAGALALVLAACGGSGVGSNGTGETKQGSGVGTVTGFGSVIIDGVAYEDSEAQVLVEGSDGNSSLTETKLGQRVEVIYEPTGTGRDLAKVIRVDASLIGPVGAVDASTGSLTVLGQTVQVNADAAQGLVTVFGRPGLDAKGMDLSAVKVGDSVEVHAVRKVVGGGTSLQATRVELLAAAPTQLRVSGVLAGLDTQGFRLGGLSVRLGSSAVIQPAGSELANDRWVLVLADAATFNPTAMQLDAARIRVGERSSTPVVADDAAVSGYVNALSSASGGGQSFQVDGVQVVTDSSTVFDPLGSTVALGRYVRVEGVYGADRALHAKEVHVHSEQDGAVVSGTLLMLNDDHDTFLVRDTWVVVDARNKLHFDECNTAGHTVTDLANGLYVTVAGKMVAGALEASSVTCKPEATASVVEREGTILSVSEASRSLTMSLDNAQVLKVTWTDSTTYFRDLHRSDLKPGLRIDVEGKLSAGSPAVLAATKIKRD